MRVNFTNFTNPEDFILDAPNQATGGMFWTAIIYLIWVVLLIILSYFGWEIAILGATTFALFLAIMLVYMGVIAWYTVLFFVGVLLFYILYIIWSKKY